jgi:hypothetical protein
MGRQSRLKKERRLERETRAREKTARALDGMRRGCLICRESDGGFTSEEHPLPESMGNTEVVLPNGVVCDTCNHERLSDLDQTLCEFFPLKMRRTMLGIESKSGKVPLTKFATGSVRNDGLTPDGQAALYFEINSAKDKKTFYEKSRSGDRVELSFNAKGGRRLTPRYGSLLSRSLLKSALECAWLDHGEAMLQPAFDHVRAAILGEPRDGFFAIARKGNPNDTGTQLVYNIGRAADGRATLWVVGNYYGIAIGTDSRHPEPLEPLSEEDAIVLRFRADAGGRLAA